MNNYIYKETFYLKNIINKDIYMIGIGGSSMSVLAEFLIHLGYNVSGSDEKSSQSTDRLISLGAKVYIGHNKENIENPGLVVYTVAVKQDNPEYMETVRKNIPLIDRSTLLGEIMALYPKSVSVAGTHGKTTTTSMISTILKETGRDPNLHIGGTIKNKENNFMIGGNEFFINEACEYYNSFLHFKSFIGIVLNIEPDHLDFFGSFEKLIESFNNFVSIIPSDGHLIVCKDHNTAMGIIPSASCNITTYSAIDPLADFTAKNIKYDSDGFGYYDLYIKGVYNGTIHLKIPGLHNISNSLAAVAACYILGCSAEECITGIEAFKGTARRFELRGSYNGINIIDDYAHHPSEITATLSSLKNASYNKIWAVFQPHTYTRTKKMFDEFSQSFNDCDLVIVADIYAARELDPGDIHSSQLAGAINKYSNNAIYKDSLDACVEYLRQNAQSGDAIITLGAGNVNIICDILLKK